AKFLQLRFQVGLESSAVLAFEGTQLLEASFQHGALLVDGSHDLGVFAFGVGLQGVGLLLGLAQLSLGTGLGVGQHRVGALPGVGDRGLGVVTALIDDLVCIGASIGHHPLRFGLGSAGEPVGGVLRQGQNPGGLHGVF